MPTSTTALPVRLGRYTVLGRLGAGGMAEVLLAHLEGAAGFGRYVAIKRLLPHFAQDSELATMFVDEGRVLARIRHPNVVLVEDLVDDGEAVFLVMEHLVGESLAGLLQELPRRGLELSADLAGWIVAEAAAGLHAAHTLEDDEGRPLRLVHRDVSPQNLFVTTSGDVKVLDFGIARHEDRLAVTRERGLRGKLAYMAPEQLAGKALDRRADLFALGAVLYEMLVGRRLFRRDTDVETIRAVCVDPIPDPRTFVPSLPAVFAEICLRALARDPDRRFRSAAELREALLSASMIDSNAPRDELALLLQRACGDALEARTIGQREAKRRLASTHPPPSSGAASVVSSTFPDPPGPVASVPPGAASIPPPRPEDDTAPEAAPPASHPPASRPPTSHRSASSPPPMSSAGGTPPPSFHPPPLPAVRVELPPPALGASGRGPGRGTVLLALASAAVVAALAAFLTAPTAPSSALVLREASPVSDDAVPEPSRVARGPEPIASSRLVEVRPEPAAPSRAAIEPEVEVEVRSEPDGARVELDGEAMGTTPTTLRLVPDTEVRRLRISRDGFRVHEVALVPDRSALVHAVLRRRSTPPRDEALPPIEGPGLDLEYPE